MWIKWWGWWVGCCVAFSLSGISSAWAIGPMSDEWTFTVAPYIWAAGMKGDLGLKGFTKSINDSALDIMQDSDSVVVFKGDLSASKGPWTFFVAPSYVQLGKDDTSVASQKADIEETVIMLDVGTHYRVFERSLANTPGGTPEWANQFLTFDVLLGAQYTHIEFDFEFKESGTVDKGEGWVDPYIGGITQIDFTERLLLRVRADVGGFGVGSDFSWNASGIFGYKVRPFDLHGTIFAGYRALYQDFSTGSGSDRFVWDMILHGPKLGFAGTF